MRLLNFALLIAFGSAYHNRPNGGASEIKSTPRLSFVTGLNVFLPVLPSGQHYWLNVTPIGDGTWPVL